MNTATERRQFPRVSANFPVRISPRFTRFTGNTVDLSEAGMRFITDKPLPLSQSRIRIEFSSEEAIETEFETKWRRSLTEEDKFAYGGPFRKFNQKEVDCLRRIVISSHIKELLEEIQNNFIKNEVSNFFMVQVKEYLNRVSDINDSLLNKMTEPKEIEDKLSLCYDFVVQRGDELESRVNNKAYIKKIKYTFRKLNNSWINRSLITKHALEKPKGYPGDYELLEIIYNNMPISEGLGLYYDRILLANEYAVGVRERKNRMKCILEEFITSNSKKKLNILNLACGSSRELRELFINEGFRTDKELSFVCVDWDEEALKFSKEQLNNLPKNLSFIFLKKDIIELSLNSKQSDFIAEFDLVYNIGLADYLPDRVLKKFIEFCIGILSVGGKFVIAHKDIKKHRPLKPNWVCDWNFYARDEGELLELIKSIGLINYSIKKEYIEPSCIFFITLDKN